MTDSIGIRVPLVRRMSASTAAILVACAGLSLAVPGIARAQGEQPAEAPASAPASDRPTDAAVLANFLHFVMIDNHDLAESFGTELLSRGLSPADLVKLIEAGDTDRFLSITRRAARVNRLEPVANALLATHQTGLLGRARDAAEITRNIELLTGNLRGKLLARDRLVAAGEYAVPQLLAALLDRTNLARAAEVRQVLIALGRQSVVPLGTALLGLTPPDQQIVAEVLGQIPYRTSLPYLADLVQSTDVPAVRAAAQRAIDTLGSVDADPAGLYQRQAEGYFSERREVTSFPGETHQLLWSFDPRAGLAMTAIRTEVFHEAMAMRLTERAMRLQSTTGGAQADTMALWVASNYVRELSSPQGYENPAYPATRRGADYFGVAAGPQVAQLVLARALDVRNTPLARRALAAVERTAGVEALNVAGRRPLLDALDYPNQRVRIEAALAIAAASPSTAFPGSDRVVPTLASAIRGEAAQYAVVLTGEAELYQRLRGMFEAQGYTVLPQGRTFADVSGPISEAPGVELIVVAETSADRAIAAIDAARAGTKTTATPALVLTSPEGYIDLTRRFDGDASVAVRQLAAGDEAAAKAATDVVLAAAGGPITGDEARAYRDRSLAALRDLAVSGSSVLAVGDAAPALIGALEAAEDDQTRTGVADILSRVNQARAQRAVMDAGLAAEGDVRAALFEAVAASAKRFGGQLEERQVARLLELANQGGDAEAASAAALMGALNLPNGNLLPMVLDGK